MVNIVIYKNEMQECVGFETVGHAEFGEYGQDIVCAAISVLITNTINAIESFTKDETSLVTEESQGIIKYEISGKPSKETTLLLDTMILGLQTMVDDENYEKYIDLTFEEV